MEASDIVRIFVICTPKSGSSFVVALLQALTGFGHLRPTLDGEPMLEADPYSSVIEASEHSSVSQLHCRPKSRTMELCERLSINPIFITRNIFDSLLSMKEYIDSVPHPVLFPHYYNSATEDERRAYIINVYAPIFIRLAAEWQEAWKAQPVPILWCTYENFFNQPDLHVRHILAHIGPEYPSDKIRTAIDAVQADKLQTKFNKGIAGRGREFFATDECQRITDLIKSYRGFDSKLAGILV